ncbi:DUF3040 domain-containing protein [Pseudonocardia sp. GCM10023141]|uniref:DUF3040 domain-containing protein n=1 Tax=Pseudonocardia sp. GCM10023141 TaxID=3252653 RepID=UPI00360FF1A5
MPLSPREQRILAEIAGRLSEQDPVLTARLARSSSLSALSWRFPLSPGHIGLLVLALTGLVGLHSFGPALGDIGLGILTVALIVPWTVFVILAAARRAGVDEPAAPWAGSADESGRQFR